VYKFNFTLKFDDHIVTSSIQMIKLESNITATVAVVTVVTNEQSTSRN